MPSLKAPWQEKAKRIPHASTLRSQGVYDAEGEIFSNWADKDGWDMKSRYNMKSHIIYGTVDGTLTLPRYQLYTD